MADHNCTNPPHFPPHCGCPAGFYPGDDHPADNEKPKPHPEGGK